MRALSIFLRVWQPREVWEFADRRSAAAVPAPALTPGGAALMRAWMPWLFLSVAVILWGLAPMKALLNGGPRGLSAYRAGERPVVSAVTSPSWDVPLLHRLVFRDYPVVPARIDPAQIADPAYRSAHGEAAVFTVNWASATGTAILLASLATALLPAGHARASCCRLRSRPSVACVRRWRRSC